MKSISCKTRKRGNVASREQQRCQPAYHSESIPRERLGRLNFLNPLSCYVTLSFASRGVRRQVPWGFFSAWQQSIYHPAHLSGFPGQERRECLGEMMMPSFILEAFLRGKFCLPGFLLMEGSWKATFSFGESLFHGALSAGLCFSHFSPINKSGESWHV